MVQRLNYAKTNSDVISKIRGVFDEELKAKRDTRRALELSEYQIVLTFRDEEVEAKEKAD